MLFAFDLDGTITKEETLPLLARELDLYEEMKALTEITLQGVIDFRQSFRLRFQVLKDIPVARIQEIMAAVEFNEDIAGFIREHQARCAVVTGNLDVWIEPLVRRLGCRVFASRSSRDVRGGLHLLNVLDKGAVIRQLRQEDKVTAVGESFNDIEMFKAADFSIAYGGVHAPVQSAVIVADVVAYDSQELCRMLSLRLE